MTVIYRTPIDASGTTLDYQEFTVRFKTTKNYITGSLAMVSTHKDSHRCGTVTEYAKLSTACNDNNIVSNALSNSREASTSVECARRKATVSSSKDFVRVQTYNDSPE